MTTDDSDESRRALNENFEEVSALRALSENRFESSEIQGVNSMENQQISIRKSMDEFTQFSSRSVSFFPSELGP